MPIFKRKLLNSPNKETLKQEIITVAARLRRVLEELMSARYIFICIKEEELGCPSLTMLSFLNVIIVVSCV